METIQSGPSLQTAAKRVKVDRNTASALVIILLLDLGATIALDWDGM